MNIKNNHNTAVDWNIHERQMTENYLSRNPLVIGHPSKYRQTLWKFVFYIYGFLRFGCIVKIMVEKAQSRLFEEYEGIQNKVSFLFFFP